MKTFGNIKVDDDRYIVIPIVIDGVHRTDYEIPPYMVSHDSIADWVEHMQSKGKWWKEEYNNSLINALNFVASGTQNNSI